MDTVYNTKNIEFTVAPGCPWHEAQQTYGAANVNWCEPTICSIINEPANAWSNLAYIMAALYMIKKVQSYDHPILKDFGWAILFVGITSFVYHATNNFLTQFYDFLGMYAMSSMFLAVGVKRLQGNLTGHRVWFWFFMFLNTTLFWFFYKTNIAVQQTFIINIIAMLSLELFNLYREKFFKKSLYLLLGFIFISIGQVFSVMDLKRIWCEPNNVFLHGHALWHCFGGICCYFLFLHLKRVTEHYKKN